MIDMLDRSPENGNSRNRLEQDRAMLTHAMAVMAVFGGRYRGALNGASENVVSDGISEPEDKQREHVLQSRTPGGWVIKNGVAIRPE